MATLSEAWGIPHLDFDEADEFYFDKATGRFRFRSGAGKGQFAPRTAVLALTRANINARSAELIDLGDSLSNGDISLLDFQLSAAKLLKRIHVQSAILGANGVDQMTSQDWLRVARTLKTQFYDGKDPDTGKRFGLTWLANDIKQGTVTPAQLRYRLNLYAQSGNLSYWNQYRVSEKRAGKLYAIRNLGQAEHCQACEAYAALPPQSIDIIILPTQKCQCRAACKCEIVTLTLQEAIDRGLQDYSELDFASRPIGSTKVKNGRTYVLNKNHRWERTEKDSGTRSTASGNDGSSSEQRLKRFQQEEYQRRKEQYLSNPDDFNDLLLGEAQKTFWELKQEKGKAAAEEVLDRYFDRLSRRAATRRERELQERIADQADERAIRSVYPWFDADYIDPITKRSGAARFRATYPDEYKTLRGDYRNRLNQSLEDRQREASKRREVLVSPFEREVNSLREVLQNHQGRDRQSAERGSPGITEDPRQVEKLMRSWGDKMEDYLLAYKLRDGQQTFNELQKFKSILSSGTFKSDLLNPLVKVESDFKEALQQAKGRLKEVGTANPDRLNFDRISDNSLIVSWQTAELEKKKTKSIGLVNSNGDLESLALWKRRKDSIYIDLLSTSPVNLDPNDPRRVKGAGTRAIAAVVKKSLELGKNGQVTLAALDGAVSFYEQLGFRQQKSGYYKLDASAAKALLEKTDLNFSEDLMGTEQDGLTWNEDELIVCSPALLDDLKKAQTEYLDKEGRFPTSEELKDYVAKRDREILDQD